jgi:long-chain acyl-CoA synthetase
MIENVLSTSNKWYPLDKRDTVRDLKELVDYTSRKYGERNAFTWEDDDEKEVNISFNRFRQEIDALGSAFYEKGIKNERIVLLGESSYLWVLTYFAGANGGSAIVPLDKNLSAEQLEVLVKDSEAGVLVYSKDFADIAADIKSEKLKLRLNLHTDILKMIESGKELVAKNAPSAKEFIEHKVDAEKMAAIIYTSGTTGISKGVMLSHKNLASNINQVTPAAEIYGRELLVLPLNHSFAFTACILCSHYYGCDIAINKSLTNILADMQKFKPDSILLVPLFVEKFYARIWANAEKSGKAKLLRKMIKVSNFLLKFGIDLRRKLFKAVHQAFGGNLVLIVTGGAPIDERYIQGFRELGIITINGYGITECSPVVSVNRNYWQKPGSIGYILPGIKIKIFEPDEKGMGEICVQGDNVMMGYYNNPEATREAFLSGGNDGKWFRTGDIGYKDEDDFLYISGRKKNLIILSNGENVSPEGIEQEIMAEMPYVQEVVVFQDDAENMIVAEAYFNPEYIEQTGTHDVDYARKFARDIVAYNRKQPPQKNIGKTLVRDEEFPKTTTKKIKRNYNK